MLVKVVVNLLVIVKVVVQVLAKVVVQVVRTMNNEDVSDHVNACMQLIKMDQCQCTGPFGWTDQPEKNPKPVPSEGRFQASPEQNSPNPKARKKITRHAHLAPLSFGGWGRNLFHLLGVECPGCGSGMT